MSVSSVQPAPPYRGGGAGSRLRRGRAAPRCSRWNRHPWRRRWPRGWSPAEGGRRAGGWRVSRERLGHTRHSWHSWHSCVSRAWCTMRRLMSAGGKRNLGFNDHLARSACSALARPLDDMGCCCCHCLPLRGQERRRGRRWGTRKKKRRMWSPWACGSPPT
jgi:hypothetical protein